MDDSTEQGGSGGGFEDPTAPTWATPDPTQPIPSSQPPATPPSPYAAPEPYVAPQPPQAAPYGQAPYGQPPQTGPYGQPPYGQSPYGQSPYPPPPVPYGAPQQNNGALTLTIVSAVATVMCCLLCLPALIFGIVALSKQSTDPQASARMTRYGWIALGICVALGVLLVVAFVALGLFGVFDASTSYDYERL